MPKIYHKILIAFFLISLSVSACTRATPTTQPHLPSPTSDIPTTMTTPSPSPTPLPSRDDLLEDAVLLWSTEALASSSQGSPNYDPWQATGKPNTFACGNFVTAWQPDEAETEAWIEFSISPYILPYEIHLVHSFHPGQVQKVEVITLDDQLLAVYDAAVDPYPDITDCPVTRVFPTDQVDVLIRAVRITLQRPPGQPWTQVDALGVWGLVSEQLEEPATTLGEEGEDGEFGGSLFFSNKNEITSLVFTPDWLWAASPGGVTAWDLDSLAPQSYTHADGLPRNATQALAYCTWEGGILAAGGAGGVSLLYLDGTPYFSLLEHPGDEFYGRVETLACDPIRRQLWVGYTSFLSRYDFTTDTWRDYNYTDGLPGGTVRQVSFIDEDVWVALTGGMAILRNAETLEGYTPENSFIPSMFIHAITSDGSSTVWMASSEGLIQSVPGGWQTWSAQDIGGEGLTDIILGLAPASDGTFWLADHFGTLCQFDPLSKTCLQVTFPPEDISLSAFVLGEQGWAAVGTPDKGVYLVVDGEWFHLLTKDQALDNTIHAIAYTPDGRVWVAGERHLQYFQANQPSAPWGEVPLPGDAVAFTFLVASDGLWIGHTRGATFLPYIGEDVLQLPVDGSSTPPGATVMAMSRDANGLLYLGTDSGLNIWDGQNFQFFDLLTEAQRTQKSYPSRVNAIYADGQTVWVAAVSGLHKFVNGRLEQSWDDDLREISTFYQTSVGLIAPSPRGEELLVGIGSQLFGFDGAQFILLLELPSEIRSIYPAPYSLWLATASSGIYSVSMDEQDVYWDSASHVAGFSERYGYQSILMSDAYTLWFASLDGGLERTSGTFGQ
jgi:hypothetical protein